MDEGTRFDDALNGIVCVTECPAMDGRAGGHYSNYSPAKEGNP